MSDVESVRCSHCGTPRPIDSWCASEQCAERVTKAQAEESTMRRELESRLRRKHAARMATTLRELG